VNTINNAAKLTFQNGFHSYPEDCPQREKAGWTEDALLSAHGSIYNFDALNAYKKWIQDLMDAQHEPTGQVPDIVPTPLWGKPTKIKDQVGMGQWTSEFVGNMADPWWGGVLIMLPWRLYLHYGDKRLLHETYPAMYKYVNFLLNTTKIGEKEYSYLIDWRTILGDWLEVGSSGSANRTPAILTCTQAFYNCCQIMAQIATILNISNDKEYFHEIAEKVKTAYNEEFLDPETGLYSKDSQSAHAMGLVLEMVPQDIKPKTISHLIQNVEITRKGHLSTGIVGTYFLYQALSQNKRPDLAFNVITASGFPSFEHNLTRINNATPLASTTLWEDWGGKSSLAHPVQGTVSSYFYEYLAGIQPLIEHPGFKQFRICPQFIENLEWVQAQLETGYGQIKVNWKCKEKDYVLDVEIPPNTSAIVHLPCKSNQQILENNQPLKIGFGIQTIQEEDEKKGIIIGSGHYQFKIMRT
jgi:alpha-L-rhamnosidase